MVVPSTAFAVLVADAAGLVVVNDADVALPRARFVALLVRSTPAFWNASTTRALPVRLTWAAVFSGREALNDTVVAEPSKMLTAPVAAFHVTWDRSLTVNARCPPTYTL